MSSIVGILRRDGSPVAPAQIDLMLQPLEHRGSLSGRWAEGPIGLGQRFFPGNGETAAGPTPPIDTARSRVLVADARLDNPFDLRRELGRRDASPSDLTEGKLILAAYEKWWAKLSRDTNCALERTWYDLKLFE